MFLSTDELIIYTDIKNETILNNVILGAAGIQPLTLNTLGELITYCEMRGFTGNLWAAYLTDVLVNSENTYSLACEVGSRPSGSIVTLALLDMEKIYGLFHADIAELIRKAGIDDTSVVTDYKGASVSQIYETAVRDNIEALSKELYDSSDATEMLEKLTGFYVKFGVGDFGLHRAFVLERETDGTHSIVPVLRMERMTLDDLYGYEIPKGKLTENTDAFIAGRPANNCLLYGDAGTGKSSCIRAIATEYYDRGLRVIQVKRDQYELLDDLIADLKNRNYRFIIYMDDLSFEEFETDYKYLKAVIEGGLEMRPDNILIYATSNRRHLIKEKVSDRDDRDEDMHRSDTMAEKLSLSQRFGVSIYFGTPSKKEFDLIVTKLAQKYGIDMPVEMLLAEANKWELSHGGRSGRTARQFIDHLLGRAPERSDT